MNNHKTRQNDPKQAVAQPIDTKPALISHGAVAHARRCRVLVMHSDEEIRRLIAVSLTLEGFEVTTAASGQDCLYKVRAAMPDIFITTNVNIHEQGERGAVRQVRQYLAYSRIKVLLIICALEPEEDPRVDIGIATRLTAPFDPTEMIRTARNLAGMSQSDPPSLDPPEMPEDFASALYPRSRLVSGLCHRTACLVCRSCAICGCALPGSFQKQLCGSGACCSPTGFERSGLSVRAAGLRG